MLTRQQHRLLEYLDAYSTRTGYCPSFDEMAEGLGLASKSGIHRLLTGLEDRGFIRRNNGHVRSIEVTRRPEATLSSENLTRFVVISALLTKHVELVHALDGTDMQIGKAMQWLATALATEVDNAGVATRLRRISAAMSNAATELNR